MLRPCRLQELPDALLERVYRLYFSHHVLPLVGQRRQRVLAMVAAADWEPVVLRERAAPGGNWWVVCAFNRRVESKLGWPDAFYAGIVDQLPNLTDSVLLYLEWYCRAMLSRRAPPLPERRESWWAGYQQLRGAYRVGVRVTTWPPSHALPGPKTGTPAGPSPPA